MRNQNKLILEQLDRKLQPFKGTEKIQIPTKGWINTIRKALNMTLEQFGKKMNITKQGMKKIEESEAADSISIKSMKEVGKVIDMRFVYGYVPNTGTFEKMVAEKSHELAKKIVLRTNQNMLLEDQGTDKKRIQEAINELTLEIKREIRRSIWD
jgi:predicted DNA-binding mobile mystery protein A